MYAAEFADIARLRTGLTARQKELTPTLPCTGPEPEKAADVVCHVLHALCDVLTAPEFPTAKRHDLLSAIVETVVADTDFGKNGLKAVTICVSPSTGDKRDGETVLRYEIRRKQKLK